MQVNLQRSTPGRLLVLWAGLMTGVLIFSWRIHLNRADYDWSEYPTALGDHDYYAALSANDYHTPSLKFPHQEAGLFRRMVKPVKRDDAEMLKLARDNSNRVFVYEEAGKPAHYFVKAAEDHYIEFGTRKFWPPYRPPVK